MPIYTCECKSGHRQDYHSSVEERNKTPKCETCGSETKKVISNYAVVPDLEPYLDEHIGSEPVWVKSKQHRQRLLKENGLSEKFGKGWH